MDNLSVEQRSYCMSRIRSKNTGIERAVRSAIHRRGYRFRIHAAYLPGSPDIVFPRARVAVFIDGDFWHGFRFAQWAEKLSDRWQQKIAGNRCRDRRNRTQLRKLGWRVIRLWQHEVKRDLDKCVGRVLSAADSREQGISTA